MLIVLYFPYLLLGVLALGLLLPLLAVAGWFWFRWKFKKLIRDLESSAQHQATASAAGRQQPLREQTAEKPSGSNLNGTIVQVKAQEIKDN